MAASTMVLSDLVNVVRFMIDKASQAATNSEVKKMQETAEKGSEHKIHPHLDEKSSNEALSELGKLKSQATKLLSFIGITVSLTKMNQIVESFSEVNDKIKYASDSLEDQQAIQDKILQSANECRTSYEEFGTYVADLSSQSKDLFPIDDAREFAKLLSQNETVAGKASNLSNVQTMLKSVFSTGTVSSTVFAQLKKTAPEVVDVLSEGLGKTEKQLESMAAGGTLTAKSVKEAYTKAADSISKKYEDTAASVSDALTIISNRFGKKITDMNEKFKITETVAKVMLKGFGAVEKVLGLIESGLDKISSAVGGTENMLKLLALAVAAIFTAWKGPTIISGLKKILSLLNPAGAKIALIAGAILAVFLLVEDFVSFLQGKDSVFADLLEGAGIDADEAREKILGFFSDLKQKAQDVLKAVGQWWEENKSKVQAVLQTIWSVVQQVFNFIYQLVGKVVGKCKAWWSEYGDSVVAVAMWIWQRIQAAFEGISQFVALIIAGMKLFWSEYGDSIVDAISAAVDLVMTIFGGLFEFISKIINGDTAGAFESLKETVDKVVQDINRIFQDAFGIDILGAISDFVDSAKGVLGDLFGWITQNFPSLSGLVDGVSSFFGVEPTTKTKTSTLGNTVSAGKTTNTNNNSVEQHVQNTFYCTDKDMATKAGGAIKTSSKNAADELANQMAHTGR